MVNNPFTCSEGLTSSANTTIFKIAVPFESKVEDFYHPNKVWIIFSSMRDFVRSGCHIIAVQFR